MSVTAVPLQPLKRSYTLWLWLGIIVAVVAALALAWSGTRAAAASKGTADQFLAWNKGRLGVHTTASGLQYQELKAGTGPNAVDGDGAAVTVSGTKRDGTIFQPSAPLQVPVGQGRTIKGFDEALKLMNKGSKYRFWLPPQIGYNDAGPQHPLYGQVLIFDIEMNELIPAEQLRQMMMQQMMMQQQQQQGGAPGGPGGPQPGGPEGPQPR